MSSGALVYPLHAAAQKVQEKVISFTLDMVANTVCTKKKKPILEGSEVGH